MKKISLLALLLAVCLLPILPVSAEAAPMKLEKVAEVPGGEMLKGNDGLIVFTTEDRQNVGLQDTEGNVRVEAKYVQLRNTDVPGYIEAIAGTEINQTGLIDGEGKVLIPMEYGVVEVLSKGWGFGVKLQETTSETYDYKSFFGKGHYIAEGYTFYNLNTGEQLKTFERSEFESAKAFDEFVLVRDHQENVTVYNRAFEEQGKVDYMHQTYKAEVKDGQTNVMVNGTTHVLFTTPYSINNYFDQTDTYRVSNKEYQQGVVDGTGKELIAPAYEKIGLMYGDYATYGTNEDKKLGLVGLGGKEVTPLVYDEFVLTFFPGQLTGSGIYMVDGYVAVIKDGMVGYINEQGEETVKPEYGKDNVKVYGNVMVATDMKGNKVLIAADGVVTELPYKEVDPIVGCMNGRVLKAKDEAGNLILIDWHGNNMVEGSTFDRSYDFEATQDGTWVLAKSFKSRTSDLYKVAE